ncbi:kinase [Enterocloster clostridioformis]|uniref:AAA family ATPase n=1 Tax=Enterocloster clostridioformis TaxID=1531 RepID=UPI00080C44EB|nr:AAA family ATPase [Enterocloster clostridioformis]ANU48350.1 kinase [Lachnoclostridium sp. YL32]NDO29400.1 ATP-binding protein [Enterocloster clostridioformis]OXE68943.1 kinase [Enterocloster clostridioformis]QQR02759.1 AAA family ATPase [Enterocloster clostridioformis]
MNKILILLAGYPATGKTFLCRQIRGRHPEFEVVSQDAMKEELWDTWGFDDIERKTELENMAWGEYYKVMDSKMSDNRCLISDYPFSKKQKGTLEALSDKHGYQVVTIRLTGDIDTLYERSRLRDLDPSRHLGHLVSRYHRGDVMEDRSQADCLVTYEIFRERCTTRGYDTFCLGRLIEVDVTDFHKVDYGRILDEIDRCIIADK